MPKRGDVVLIPFPFSDLSGQKIRPALVLSVRNQGTDIIVVFITSKQKLVKLFTVPVLPTVDNGIKTPSLIICDKIATLDKKMILGRVGVLDVSTQNLVATVVAKVLGL